jgi:hypothetical protein
VNLSKGIQITGGIIVAMVNLSVFLIIFAQRWEQRLALFMVVSLLAGNIMHEAFSDRQIGAIVYHCFAAVFLAFAVTVILKRVFQRQTIRTDDVGALCEYLLAGAAWGNIEESAESRKSESRGEC